ncbi:MAG: tetratricopeptide repeat protein [Gammaproteobacteria bacterium]|nr:tetratricopeptide repeat protein [Gammaproteobacteria bacterium]
MTRTTGATLVCACLLLLTQPGQAQDSSEGRYRTTHPDIALRNLDFQVNRARIIAQRQPGDAGAVRGLLDQLLTRAQFRGSYSDYDEALTITERLLGQRPDDPLAKLERARILERLHRFDEAETLLTELEAALDRVALDRVALDRVALDPDRRRHVAIADDAARARIRIALARGVPERVLADAERRAASNPGFGSLSQLAFTLHALGRIDEAEATYLEALEYWDQISPFAVSWIEFQRGELHVDRDPARAAVHYRRALDYMPAYVTARVHLAEALVEVGAIDEAIELLEAIAGQSEEPEVDSRLAEFLMAAGRHEEAAPVRERALRDYAELLERHPLAFLDHIAEFWLGSGNDPQQAWDMAERNLANAASDPALALAIEAAAAAERPELCELLERAGPRRARFVELDELIDEFQTRCPDAEASGPQQVEPPSSTSTAPLA